jgi:hypothetical protein
VLRDAAEGAHTLQELPASYLHLCNQKQGALPGQYVASDSALLHLMSFMSSQLHQNAVIDQQQESIPHHVESFPHQG